MRRERLRIVSGNDFATLVVVRAFASTGEELQDWSLADCEDVTVTAVSRYGRQEMEHEVVADTALRVNCLRVEWPSDMAVCEWGLEITGTHRGRAWRSMDAGVVTIVATNAEACIPEASVIDSDYYRIVEELRVVGGGRVQSDWEETDPDMASYVRNKPLLSDVATSGQYDDLLGRPTLPQRTSQLQNDSGFVTQTELASKVDKESGKGLSTNDYTNADKQKLDNLQPGETNVQADWNETDTTDDAYIKNKPTIPDTTNLATKTEVENAKVEALKAICPWFEGLMDTDDCEIIDEYPDESVYSQASVILDCTYAMKFFLYSITENCYYTKWESFRLFSDCKCYNIYDEDAIFAQGGIFYDSANDGLYASDSALIWRLEQQSQADWNQTNTHANSYIKNKPDLNLSPFLPVTSVISTSPSNVRTTNGGDAAELVYSTNTKQVYNKIGSYLYTQWNGKVVSNIYYSSHQAYRTTTSNTTGAAKNNVWLYPIGTTYVYRNNVKYDLANLNTSFATVATSGSYNDLSNKPTIPAAPGQLDFVENSYLLKEEIAYDDPIRHKHYAVLDFENDGITGDCTLFLNWEINNAISDLYGENYNLDDDIIAPEAIVELHTAPNSTTRISIEDLEGNPVKWITPAIGVLDADSYYLISIVDGTAGIIKLEERTYA